MNSGLRLVTTIARPGDDSSWVDSACEGKHHQLCRNVHTALEYPLASTVIRLRIASQCSLDGKFLIVRGDLRTDKIHLGSGNI